MKFNKNLLWVLFCLFLVSIDLEAGERWTEKQADSWYATQGWLRGSDFQPSSAINQLEMWQKDTFDPETIDRELAMAADIGMNCMRVYLHHLAWETDCLGFKERVNRYLDIADKYKISTIFVFFDDCWNADYEAGKQPEPVPGIHNSGWVRDPGDLLYRDSLLPGRLEKYVKDILSSFSQDKRIVFWDLYNEPGNSGYGNKSLPLLRKVFSWARCVDVVQPLSAGIWNDGLKDINTFILNNSDIVSYHNYRSVADHRLTIDTLKKYRRPMICTEYMNRRDSSYFQTIMPLLKESHVGAINWGLVAGKTNTIYAWDQPMPEGGEPALWFHDIFRKDGTPFSEEEISVIKKLTGHK